MRLERAAPGGFHGRSTVAAQCRVPSRRSLCSPEAFGATQQSAPWAARPRRRSFVRDGQGSARHDTVVPHGSHDSRIRTALPATRRCSSLTGRQQSTVVTAPIPACGPGQVLVRIRRVGVCATELPMWWGGPAVRPVVLGREPVGEVVTVGAGVTVCGVGGTVTGRIARSFAQYAVADALDTVVVPPGVSTDSALGEPPGCVVEAPRRTPVAIGGVVHVCRRRWWMRVSTSFTCGRTWVFNSSLQASF
ncbi:alcohol dehydrogenase catalytic domain-containing protein [Streptomyces sp. PTD5-9]|uniref:alcohol dehydrogenase catalytic domain-containing protein n=1 Tax=Streptomyces sp. PTD5-9 TaxID=3120150 RepID=UPI003FCE406C